MYSKDDDKFFQRAIIFASEAMATCHNNKPVLVHSLRMAQYLYNYAYNINVVVGALLHDLVEDTDVSLSDIEKEFGSEIAQLVNLLTMDCKIEDYKEQFIANFKRLENSKDGLIIRCADIMDNAPYIKLAPVEVQNKVKEKHQYFYNKNKDILQNEPIWQDFAKIVLSE